MPTKKKTTTKKKKPNTDLKFSITIDWQGEYFENRDAMSDLFPKYETGSGVGISGNDCNFTNVPSKDLIRMIATIRDFCKKRERVSDNDFFNWGINIYLD